MCRQYATHGTTLTSDQCKSNRWTRVPRHPLTPDSYIEPSPPTISHKGGEGRQGGKSKWLHNPCCLGTSRAERNQSGYIAPAVLGVSTVGEEVAQRSPPSGTIMGPEGLSGGGGGSRLKEYAGGYFWVYIRVRPWGGGGPWVGWVGIPGPPPFPEDPSL